MHMQRRQHTIRLSVILATLLLRSAIACGDSATEDNNGANTTNNPIPSDDQSNRLEVRGYTGTQASSLALTTDGVVVGSGTQVMKLKHGNALAWLVELTGLGTIRSVAVDPQGRVLVISQAGFGPARIARLNADGTLDRAVSTPDKIFLAEVSVRQDGSMMFNDSTLVDQDFMPISRGNFGQGQRIIAVSDGYLVLSAQGLSVTKLDMSGDLVWQTTAQLPTANYTTVGLRQLGDGSILAAVSGDVNPGHALVVVKLDAQGNIIKANNPKFEGLDQSGISVPLQFGAGIQLASHGDKTYVSFEANSGALGSDVRGAVLAELNADGEVTGALYGGGGLGVYDGITVSASDRILLAPTMASGACSTGPSYTNQAITVTGQPMTPQLPEEIPSYTFSELNTVTVTPVEAMIFSACPSE